MTSAAMSDVSVVVVTHNGLPWIEQALASVRGVETVLVDNGSADGTAAFVRERFPDVVVLEQENRGLAAGWNAGIARTSGRYVLLLNSDAWLDEGALEALVAFADAHPDAAVVGPRLRNPDGKPAALGARFPDALAARDRVPLHPQARARLGPRVRPMRQRDPQRRLPPAQISDHGKASSQPLAGWCRPPFPRRHVERVDK